MPSAPVPDEVRPPTDCDWCSGEVTDAARAGSLAIGLPLHLTWACEACLSDGSYRNPPQGWGASASDWPAADALLLTADELGLVTNALNELLHGPDAIEEWEFVSRMGRQRDQARALLHRLRPRTSGR